MEMEMGMGRGRTMDDTFASLWNLSESVALKQYAGKETVDVLVELGEILYEFRKNDLPMKELEAPLRKRQIGLMLYLISLLSARTDVNVFAALKDEVDVNKQMVGGF
jgi:hypothetical protein